MKKKNSQLLKNRIISVFIILLIFSLFCKARGVNSGVELQGNDTVVPLHDNIRTMPYPRAEHEIYLNPPPLIVPSGLQTEDSLQFSLSQSPDFSAGNTITSKPVLWSMFSPHQTLLSGTWYWRYRSVGKGVSGMWSSNYSFNVKDTTPKFATPTFSTLIANIPATYPRLYCFIQNGITANRSKVSSFSEYKNLTDRAAGGLTWNYLAVTNTTTKINTMSTYIGYLYTAYQCTGDSKYTDKILEMNRHLLSLTIDANIVRDDFETGFFYLMLMVQSYDVCCSQFTEAERLQIENRIITLASEFYYQHVDVEEQHVYDNHFWQRTVYCMFQVGLLFHDRYPIAKELLQYYYELWTTRGPVGAFDRDGQHFYSSSYFNMDMFGLYYFSGMLSYLTKQNFLDHPWYKNAGQALLYSWPALAKSGGFGDGNEINNMPYRTRIAFADYIARETNSPYAQWYVNQCNALQTGASVLSSDFEYRLYRFAKMGQIYSNATLPVNRPKLLWFKDSGETMIHSDISNTQYDLFLSMRSSPYGSGSHTHSDQNGFNLLYQGVPVYRSTGYYLNFSDKHNLLSYRHTQAHNSILVDGIGQAFTTRAYGNITRALDGKNISYCLGDASDAYKCTSEYTLWKNAFTAAGISQTPQYGFGVTPLTKYKRHLLMLHPDKVVIYDELEASVPVCWDWLLHSPVQFSIEGSSKRIVLNKNSNPLSAIESGNIPNGCGTLSFDYIQAGTDNVNLEVSVNGNLLSTISTLNEQGVLKNTGKIGVNVSGNVVIKLKQKNSNSGKVAVDNLVWTQYGVSADTSVHEKPLLVLYPIKNNLKAITSENGLLKVFATNGQVIFSQNVVAGQMDRIQVVPGIYIVQFQAKGKTEIQKVVVYK